MMLKLQQRVQAEVDLEKNLHGLLGVMDLIMASNSTSLRRVATTDISEYKLDTTTAENNDKPRNTEVNNTMLDVEDDNEDKMNLS